MGSFTGSFTLGVDSHGEFQLPRGVAEISSRVNSQYLKGPRPDSGLGFRYKHFKLSSADTGMSFLSSSNGAKLQYRVQFCLNLLEKMLSQKTKLLVPAHPDESVCLGSFTECDHVLSAPTLMQLYLTTSISTLE